MEHITKWNTLETAKNRLNNSALTYVEGTQYVYDRILDKETSDELINYIPLVETKDGYILRYKNIMRQYYWLVNDFIPSCSYEKLCVRNGIKTWNKYSNAIDAFVKYLTFSFYDGNKLIASISVISGNTASYFTPSKVGYLFSGWTTEDGGDLFFDFNTPIIENTNVYAKYLIKQVMLTFVPDNGQGSVEIMFDYGTSSTNILQELERRGIAEPEKEGYTFTTWKPEITTATNDTVYVADYNINTYIIRFFEIIDAEHVLYDYDNQPINGGSTTEYRLVKTETPASHGQSIYYLTKPTFKHFECLEDGENTWWVDKYGNPIPASEFRDVTHDILGAFPKLTKKQYTVSFLDWDNTPITSYTVEYLSGATAPSDPVRENYTFAGWDRSYSSITNDTIIHATYIGDEITVTYKIKDTNDVFIVFSSVTTTFNSTAPKVESPSSESYPPEDYGIFDGWYIDENYSEIFDYSTLLREDTIIYGKWKTEFEVTFYNWDGTLITGDTQGFANPIYVRYGEDVQDTELDLIIENMMDKPGYDFLGWSRATTNITSDTRITAVFDDTQMCIVRFINSVDGSIIDTITVEFGTTILRSDYPSAPEVEHMLFNSWEGDTSQVFSDTDVYALYDYEKISVYFVDYNNNVLGTELMEYGHTGYTPSYLVDNITVRGYNGNEEYIASTLSFNGTYCLVRDEFDTETGCSTPEETIVTENTNRFIAQYDEISTEEVTCNIRFYNYDSSYWFTDTVLYGTVVNGEYSSEILSLFAASGYTPDLDIQEFYGWEDDKGNEYVIGQNELTVTNDISLRAKYRMISYTVQFFVQSNPSYYPDIIDMPIRSLETEVLKYSAVNRPDCSNVPERIYFETFCEGLNNRWYTDSACTNEWVFKQDVQMQPVSNPNLVENDMILYGKYIGREYSLTYNTNDGSAIETETYRYPMPTVRPTNPTKAGSTFIGWYVDDGTFVNEFTFGQPLTGDMTIYAKWFNEPEENTIIYNATSDLRNYMPDMGSSHIIQEQCIWDIATGDGILVYDAPIETFNIGVLNSDNSVSVNTYIKKKLRTITIPKDTTNVIVGQFEDCRYLYAIYVSEDNEKYYSTDGILYSNTYAQQQHVNKTTLLCYPQAKQEDVLIVNYRLSQTLDYDIANYAFANCKNLRKIELVGDGNMPIRGLGIGENSFKNCVNLNEISLIVSNEILIPNAYENSFVGVDVENCKLIVQCNRYGEYTEDSVWSQFDIQCFGTLIYFDDDSTITVDGDVLTEQIIDNDLSIASKNRGDIISIEIGNNVTEIGEYAFQTCSNLSSLTIGNNVTKIGPYAFVSASNLISLIIPDSVTTIGSYAFATNTHLGGISFGSGVNYIGYAAFRDCISIETLYLPYTISNISAYSFNSCRNLTSITCDRITPPVLDTGAFNDTNDCPIYVPCESVDEYKTAENWSVYESRIQCHQPQVGYLMFTSSEDNSTIGLSKISSYQTIEYTDDIEDENSWNSFTTSDTITLNSGETIYLRGKLTNDNSSSNYTQFTILGGISVSGNINNLWNYEDLIQPMYQFCGFYLFYDCVGLLNANELTLGYSTTVLSYYCYQGMFNGCTSLATAPELPATKLADGCYSSMFAHCSSLTTAPELPATILARYCYGGMFMDCTSLTTAPELPATTLASSCYDGMFLACMGLDAAPELPATTLADYCYGYMFYNCTSLTSAPELPATTLVIGCYQDMFRGCSSLTTAPELPATTLAKSCYYAMFYNCSNLNYIKCLAVNGISQNDSTTGWVNGVASTGTFVKHPDATSWPTGIDGIPTGWSSN